MQDWALQYGMQKAEGIEIYTADNKDYELMTKSPIAAGSTILYVPSTIVLNSDSIWYEMGDYIAEAESRLVEIDSGTAQRLPLFRLMMKILVEYEKMEESPYYSWLNSLPRVFYNGVAMTDACFECLPPYAKMLSMNERNTYSRFLNALKACEYVPLSEGMVDNDQIIKWAYNVALTRYHEIWEPQRAKIIAPMVDMLNHSSEPNCEISVDNEGNVYVSALYDIPAESTLTISLGDPTNPTPIFAQYGFLPRDCTTIFSKALHLEQQIKDLGYDFKDLLFHTKTGEISPKVWDIFLYVLLQENDPGSANEFWIACKTNDEDVKQQYHSYYFQYTLYALKEHVSTILGETTYLTMKAQNYDINSHPRVPTILAHNNLVYETFAMTASVLEQMG